MNLKRVTKNGARHGGVLIGSACLALLLWGGCGGGESKNTAPVGDDTGRTPWTVDIEKITLENTKFRATRWTGKNLQLTLMSLKPGEEIGLELHNDVDQFIRIDQGRGRVVMGQSKDALSFDKEVENDWAILVPAGYWHNLINTGNTDLKLYSIYAPPQHAPDTVHATSAESEAAHDH